MDNKRKNNSRIGCCNNNCFVFFDEKLNSSIKDFSENNPAIIEISNQTSFGGSFVFTHIAGGIMYGGGMLLKDEKLKQTGFLTLYSLYNIAFVNNAIRIIAGRKGPGKEMGSNEWVWFIHDIKSFWDIFDNQFSSFPSNRAAFAWSFATVIATQYKDNKIIPPIAYTLSMAVSISQLMANKNWVSDVIIGSALGYGIGKFSALKYKNAEFTILPVYFKNNITLTGQASWRF